MATGDVKVLGAWPSTFVNRVLMALKIKSVEYELIEMNPREKPEILLRNNPVHKKIPVLIHGDKPVCESLVIMQYIDDAWATGTSILPSDPYDRALARFWVAYIDDKWFPLVKVLIETEGEEERTELIQKVSEGLVLLEEAFVSCSEGKDFFGGESIGYLDIVLGSCLGWLRVTQIVLEIELLDRTKIPQLVKWADRFSSDDAVKDVLPKTEKLLELYRKIQAFLKAA
ncbi:glutathione S-transferase U17-like [Sesamum indicum]|uniref:glutathione transferase n=1 Tax=Sesamum indicum TaxID=4182 RepID=A0A6I9TPA5_SESIN|nr:glutathione S-transferase U17-like [Sesamum indicum]